MTDAPEGNPVPNPFDPAALRRSRAATVIRGAQRRRIWKNQRMW